MLEAYSKNKTIATNDILPFDSVSLVKGCTARLNGVSSIELNKKGVYEITLDVSGTPSEAGVLTINLLKDGVVQSQGSINIPLVATTVSVTPSITTLVSVDRDNAGTCSSSPVTIQFSNAGVGLADANTNIVITKIC